MAFLDENVPETGISPQSLCSISAIAWYNSLHLPPVQVVDADNSAYIPKNTSHHLVGQLPSLELNFLLNHTS